MTDIIQGVCNHNLFCCPHTVTGTIISGSTTTMYDGLPAARLGDLVVTNCPHCGGAGMFCVSSAQKNLIDGRFGHKINDMVIGPFGSCITISESPTCKDG